MSTECQCLRCRWVREVIGAAAKKVDAEMMALAPGISDLRPLDQASSPVRGQRAESPPGPCSERRCGQDAASGNTQYWKVVAVPFSAAESYWEIVFSWTTSGVGTVYCHPSKVEKFKELIAQQGWSCWSVAEHARLLNETFREYNRRRDEMVLEAAKLGIHFV